jgi:hypothetical protein
MITPNKFLPLDKSIIGKMSCLILDDIDEILVTELMHMKVKKFSDVGEFILALDALHALGKVELDEDRRVIRYVS